MVFLLVLRFLRKSVCVSLLSTSRFILGLQDEVKKSLNYMLPTHPMQSPWQLQLKKLLLHKISKPIKRGSLGIVNQHNHNPFEGTPRTPPGKPIKQLLTFNNQRQQMALKTNHS